MARAALVPRALALALALAVAVAAAAEGPPAFGGPVAQVASALMDPAVPLPWRAAGLSALRSHPGGAWPDLSPNCTRDLALLASSFANGSIWAIKMFDASTKIPDGVMNGNFIHMGNFDECLSVRKGDSGGPQDFDGQHCLVTLVIPLSEGETPGPGNDWQMLVNTVENTHIITGRGFKESIISEFISLELAWCTPSSCTPEDLEKIAKAAVDLTDLKINATVQPSQCHTHQGKKLRGLDIFAIWVIAVFVALAAASTAYDRLTRHRVQRHKLLLVFSVFTNWPKLIAVNSGRDQIPCLNGIRTLSMGWVVLAHVYMMSIMSPSLNIVGFAPDFIKAFNRLLITNASISVDSFFMLSGILLSFLFLKEVERTNHFNIFKFYIHRYVRLTPALAVLLLVSVTLMGSAGTGPLWDSQYDTIRASCEKNWWTNLLYVNNYVNSNEMCQGHTWYLAVDMQLYWLSPLVLIPLWKLPKTISLLWVCFLLLVGWAVPFTIVYLKELSPSMIMGTVQQLADTAKYYYFPTHTRYVPWLLGVLLGYILHEARKKKPQLCSWQRGLGWFLSTVLMAIAQNGAYPFMQPSYEYSAVGAAFWLSLFRAMWALGLGWIIFSCDQGFGGAANVVLTWNFFQPLSRLTYGMYLLHFPILQTYSGIIQSPIYLADVNLIPQFFGMVLMSVAWTIPLVLLFESPIILIEKIISGKELDRRSELQMEHQTLENEGVDEDSTEA